MGITRKGRFYGKDFALCPDCFHCYNHCHKSGHYQDRRREENIPVYEEVSVHDSEDSEDREI